MHDALWDALAVELGQLLNQVVVLQKDGAARANCRDDRGGEHACAQAFKLDSLSGEVGPAVVQQYGAWGEWKGHAQAYTFMRAESAKQSNWANFSTRWKSSSRMEPRGPTAGTTGGEHACAQAFVRAEFAKAVKLGQLLNPGGSLPE